MSAVARGLVTQQDLQARLSELGVTSGMTLLVHTRLSALGWVCGGGQAVVAALRSVLGSSGTVLVPTFSWQLSDPSGWENPVVPRDWWATIRASMPAFDPHTTPTRGMGVVADTLRTTPGAMRSSHPAVSFSALGPNAKFLIENHELDFGLGEGSPLARLYDLDGHVLLLGVGHGNNSSLHLAEYRWQHAELVRYHAGAPIMVQGHRRWVEYEDIDNNSEDFVLIGHALEKAHPPLSAKVGSGRARLFRQRDVVDFATNWMDQNRPMPED